MKKNDLEGVVGKKVYLRVRSEPLGRTFWIGKNEEERDWVEVQGFDKNRVLLKHQSGMEYSIPLGRIEAFEEVK